MGTEIRGTEVEELMAFGPHLSRDEIHLGAAEGAGPWGHKRKSPGCRGEGRACQGRGGGADRQKAGYICTFCSNCMGNR